MDGHSSRDQTTVHRLLAWCGPEKAGIVADSHGPLEDLAAMAELSLVHNVAPLFYDRLQKRSLHSALPTELVGRLHKASRDVATLNLRRQATLVAIARACAAASIRLIVLKGIYLASVVYRSVSLRPMVDMDILVPRDQLAAATAVLRRLGFTQRKKVAIDVDTRLAHHLTPFARRGVGTIELHWNITEPNHHYSIDPEILWRAPSSFQVAGETLLTLPPDQLIAHLACHLSHHHQFRTGIRPLLDLSYAINFYGGQLDWPSVVRQARLWQWTRGVYLSLRLARDLSGADVPDTVLRELQPAAVDDDLVECAKQCLVADRATQLAMPPKMSTLERHPGLFATVQYGFKLLFVSRLEIAQRYGVPPRSIFLPLFYLRWAMYLTRRYAAPLVRWLLGGDTRLATFARRQARVGHWLNEDRI